MDQIFNWIKLAVPFLELAYAAALLADPSIAAEVRKIIDAIERLGSVPVDPNAPPSAARGYDAINAFGTGVINALDALIANTGLDHDERVAQGTALNNSLSDPTKVYQAKNGKDAALLVAFKEQGKERLGTILNEN